MTSTVAGTVLVAALSAAATVAVAVVQWRSARRKASAEADQIRIGTAGELVDMLRGEIQRRADVEMALRNELRALSEQLEATRTELARTRFDLESAMRRLEELGRDRRP